MVFGDGERVEEAVDVLHVGDVTADSDYGGRVEGSEAFDIGEAGERAIGC